jgi:hypothetical protein
MYVWIGVTTFKFGTILDRKYLTAVKFGYIKNNRGMQ